MIRIVDPRMAIVIQTEVLVFLVDSSILDFISGDDPRPNLLSPRSFLLLKGSSFMKSHLDQSRSRFELMLHSFSTSFNNRLSIQYTVLSNNYDTTR